MSPHHSRLPKHVGTLLRLIFFVILLLIVGEFAMPRFHSGENHESKLASVMISNLDPLASAIDIYRVDMNQYPARLDDLSVRPSDERRAALWQGPYIRDAHDLSDRWNQMVIYRYPGVRNPETYDLFSLGPDGIEGTEDDLANGSHRQQSCSPPAEKQGNTMSMLRWRLAVAIGLPSVLALLSALLVLLGIGWFAFSRTLGHRK